MSQLKTKQISGPTSGSQGSVILFDSGNAGWSSDLNTALLLPSGPTSDRPENANVGHIRFNSDLGKLEAFEDGNWTNVIVDTTPFLKQFSFRVKLDATTGTIPTDGSGFDQLPTGWSISNATTTSFTVNHNVGTFPAYAVAAGQISPTGSGSTTTRYQLRPFTSLVELEYDIADLTKLFIQGVSTPQQVGTQNGGYVLFHIYF